MTPTKESLTPEEILADPRCVAYLRFPDEMACVKILEILAPFNAADRRLILTVVEANEGYPVYRVPSGVPSQLHPVVMPEPLASRLPRGARIEEEWCEPQEGAK